MLPIRFVADILPIRSDPIIRISFTVVPVTTIPTDSGPRFSCARPSAYVTRERICNSIKCNPRGCRKGARQILEPIRNVNFPRATKPALQVEDPRRQPEENFAPLLRDSTESPQCPKIVEFWCIICKKAD